MIGVVGTMRYYKRYQRARRKEKNLFMSGSNSELETDLEVSPIYAIWWCMRCRLSFKEFDASMLIAFGDWKTYIEKVKHFDHKASVYVFERLARVSRGVINKVSKLVGKY